MTEWMDRADWTNTAARSNGTWAPQVRGMVAHYPASGAAIGRASKERVATLLRGWRAYHVAKNWGDIGYNVAIDQAGRIWVLRGLSNVGAHCASATWKDANRYYVGVLFVVGNDEPLTPEAVQAWHDLRDQAVLPRFPGAVEVTGHGLVRGASTACPGPRVRAALPALRSRPQAATKPTTAPVAPTAPTVTAPAPITPKDDDMPLNADDLTKIRTIVREEVLRGVLGYRNRELGHNIDIHQRILDLWQIATGKAPDKAVHPRDRKPGEF